VKRIAIVDRNPEIYRSGLQDRFPEIEFKSFDMQPDRREKLQARRLGRVRRQAGGDPSDVFQTAVACSSVKWLHVGGVGHDHLGPRAANAWDQRRWELLLGSVYPSHDRHQLNARRTRIEFAHAFPVANVIQREKTSRVGWRWMIVQQSAQSNKQLMTFHICWHSITQGAVIGGCS
jgi:hypothetical protein